MIRGLARAFAALSIIAVGLAVVIVAILAQYRAPGPSQSEQVVTIPPGTGVDMIGRLLDDAGILDGRRIFRWGVTLEGAGGDLKAGEYAFPAGVSAAGVARILTRGRTLAHAITIPEGRTSAEVVALLEGDDRLTGEIAEVPAEGTLLPETYSFVRGDTRAGVLARMETAMDAALAEEWAARAEDLPVSTPEEALILASIIEKETGVTSEREMVASVFANRLRIGMRLQTDPTVIYGITGGRSSALGRELSRADLDAATPYNTYVIPGLPPGPITNPGRASIHAALHPADSEFLYFVADGSGGHAFAVTLDDHNRNVAAWRRIRQQQGVAP